MKPRISPTPKQIAEAHAAFLANEPRDLFYRAATELVERAIRGQGTLSLVEALAVLLETWNASYYRFHGKFGAQQFDQLERAIRDDEALLKGFRRRAIASFTDHDEDRVRGVFKRFEQILGPVGAAKCLHLLAPRFFPLWDRSIASAYGVMLVSMRKGGSADRYVRFMRITQEQCRELDRQLPDDYNPLKALDEYNYMHISKRPVGQSRGRR